MRGRLQAIFTRILVLLLVLCSATGATAASLKNDRDLDERITSIALNGRVHARVILPAGYADSGKRYPVVYFLHGLPAGSKAYDGQRLADRCDRRRQARRSSSSRRAPARQRHRPGVPELGRRPELGDVRLRGSPPLHRQALPDDPPPARAARSSACPRADTARRFSASTTSDRSRSIESWSGYFHPTDPTGTEPLARGPAANAHTLIGALRASQHRRPTFFAFYVGRGDKRFRAENEQFDQELTAAHVPPCLRALQGRPPDEPLDEQGP